MNIRDPRVLFGVGVFGFFALLALTDEDPTPFKFKPGPNPGPVPNPLGIAPSSGPVNLTRHLSDKFFLDVLAMAEDMRKLGARITAEDILGVLNAESGLDPRAKNRLSFCAGMNQICPTLAKDSLSGLKGVGFGGTLDQYLALSAEEQFPFVRRWFKQAAAQFAATPDGRLEALTDMGRLYLLNIAPAHVKRADDFPIYVKGRDGNAYTYNSGLDQEHKGFITVHDTDKFVKRSLAANGPFGKSSKPFTYWAEIRGRLQRLGNPAIAGLNDEEARIRIALASMGRV